MPNHSLSWWFFDLDLRLCHRCQTNPLITHRPCQLFEILSWVVNLSITYPHVYMGMALKINYLNYSFIRAWEQYDWIYTLRLIITSEIDLKIVWNFNMENRSKSINFSILIGPRTDTVFTTTQLLKEFRYSRVKLC